MKTPIAVNVRRQWPRATTKEQKAAVVRGDWIISDEAAGTAVGGLLIGVVSNKVVWAETVTQWHRADGRVRFQTAPADHDTLETNGVIVGAQAPTWANWSRGQANPVKIGPRQDTHPSETQEHLEIEIGDFSVQQVGDSLIVRAPLGWRVTVIPGR